MCIFYFLGRKSDQLFYKPASFLKSVLTILFPDPVSASLNFLSFHKYLTFFHIPMPLDILVYSAQNAHHNDDYHNFNFYTGP